MISIEDRGLKIKSKDIVSSKRIGVDYAQEDALLPYRFYIKDNKFVSKSK
jgi:DNA-3-methyladenine glycosylase